MRKDDPLALQDSISHDDLFQHPVIFTNQDMAVNEFSGWSGCKFDQLNIVAAYNLPYIVSLMVTEQIGYALCLDKII